MQKWNKIHWDLSIILTFYKTTSKDCIEVVVAQRDNVYHYYYDTILQQGF